MRKRNGVPLSIWQGGLLAVLYSGGTIHEAVGRNRIRYYWAKLGEARYRINSRTLKSAIRKRLISKQYKLTKRGEETLFSMPIEEVEGLCAAFAMHDLRATRSKDENGRSQVVHGMDLVVRMIEGGAE
jgi:hypothetical protein